MKVWTIESVTVRLLTNWGWTSLRSATGSNLRRSGTLGLLWCRSCRLGCLQRPMLPRPSVVG